MPIALESALFLYLALAFVAALAWGFCTVDLVGPLDRRDLTIAERRAYVLAVAGLVHPVAAVAAVDVLRLAQEGSGLRATDGAVTAARGSLIVSVVLLAGGVLALQLA